MIRGDEKAEGFAGRAYGAEESSHVRALSKLNRFVTNIVNVLYYKDPELAAAAYNIAAAILCGADYCGYVNPVPAPPPELEKEITNRCHSFLQEAA
jgi:hypothetical protein